MKLLYLIQYILFINVSNDNWLQVEIYHDRSPNTQKQCKQSGLSCLQ